MANDPKVERIKEIRETMGVGLIEARDLYFREVREEKINSLRAQVKSASNLRMSPIVRQILTDILDLL